jgi:mRNA-degrading endonuclease RelE of RelBE toxin-antitoxin system
VGKPLGVELAGIYSARPGRDWRVLYEIDEAKHVVMVLGIRRRSAACRRR